MVVLALKKRLLSLLEQADPGSANFEANQIMRWAMGDKAAILYPEEETDGEEAKKAIDAAMRRVKGEPLQYIFGEWEFYGLPFKVGEGVLIPRPETEILVETVLNEIGLYSDVIDLCSGSGCIPIALHKKSYSRCFGIELSDSALEYFNINIKLNKTEGLVKALKGDVLAPSAELLEQLPDKCDVITANPPYLTAEEMVNLQAEVRHEPDIALFGGADGLHIYRSIFGIWKGRLRKDGLFAVETGDSQAGTVMDIMEHQGFRCRKILDYCGTERVIVGKYAG